MFSFKVSLHLFSRSESQIAINCITFEWFEPFVKHVVEFEGCTRLEFLVAIGPRAHVWTDIRMHQFMSFESSRSNEGWVTSGPITLISSTTRMYGVVVLKVGFRSEFFQQILQFVYIENKDIPKGMTTFWPIAVEIFSSDMGFHMYFQALPSDASHITTGPFISTINRFLIH